MNINQATKAQIKQAEKAANFMLDEKMDLDILLWLATIDPILFPWLKIEQIQYKRLGGVYGDDEDDNLHNQAGDFAYLQIENAYKALRKERRAKRK